MYMRKVFNKSEYPEASQSVLRVFFSLTSLLGTFLSLTRIILLDLAVKTF